MFVGFCAGPATLLAQLANCGFPLISSTCIVELYITVTWYVIVPAMFVAVSSDGTSSAAIGGGLAG